MFTATFIITITVNATDPTEAHDRADEFIRGQIADKSSNGCQVAEISLDALTEGK